MSNVQHIRKFSSHSTLLGPALICFGRSYLLCEDHRTCETVPWLLGTSRAPLVQPGQIIGGSSTSKYKWSSVRGSENNARPTLSHGSTPSRSSSRQGSPLALITQLPSAHTPSSSLSLPARIFVTTGRLMSKNSPRRSLAS